MNFFRFIFAAGIVCNGASNLSAKIGVQRYFDCNGKVGKLPRITRADIGWLGGAYLNSFLRLFKNSINYQEFANVPHEFLLYGASEFDNVLLARAVAGEAGFTLFWVRGSDFSANDDSRIRSFFARVRKRTPCIVLIEGIDRIARRGAKVLGKLLHEVADIKRMQEPVTVIATSDISSKLSNILIAQGILLPIDVSLPLPSFQRRCALLHAYARDKKIDRSVNFRIIARYVGNFSAARLDTLVKMAAANARAAGRCLVTKGDFEEAHDALWFGKKINHGLAHEPDQLRETAYHEAGHALLTVLLGPLVYPLYKVTIVPRAKAWGVTYHLHDDRRLWHFFHEIMVCLGGYITKELVFHTSVRRDVATSDFISAANLARYMVWRKPDYDKWALSVNLSKLTKIVDREAKTILDKAYAQAKKLLARNRAKLDMLAQWLLRKKTLFARQVYALLGVKPRID